MIMRPLKRLLASVKVNMDYHIIFNQNKSKTFKSSYRINVSDTRHQNNHIGP